MLRINRQSFKPIYYQLAELIHGQIEGGILACGDQIPSERELMASYHVSRNTARLATESLMKAGLVYRVPGRGSFVASAKMRYGLLQLASFSEEMQRRGLRPGSRILDLASVSPAPKIAQGLRLAPNQSAFKIERLRLANDEPLALNTSYVPVHLCPTLDREDLEQGSLYKVLEDKYSLVIWRAEQVLRPTVAGEYEAGLLGVEPGSPMLLAEGVTYLTGDVPIEYAQLLYRGDRYEFSISPLRRVPAGLVAEAA